jgi:hypothetical protein
LLIPATATRLLRFFAPATILTADNGTFKRDPSGHTDHREADRSHFSIAHFTAVLCFTTLTALNIIGGIQHRTGLFTEIKTSVYSQYSPTLRLVIGYHF